MSPARTLAPQQVCRIVVLDVATGESILVLETDERLYEAPNWTAAGELILNGDGLLWRLLPVPGARPVRLEIQGIPELNNDHVLAPDGETIYLSANDRHIYSAPLAGGTATRITPNTGTAMHFLHGVSPDGSTLAYIRLEPEDESNSGAVHTIGADGSNDTALTDGSAHADGSEYSPDGQRIYFNTEQFSEAPGHAQIARMHPDGSNVEQLTVDERVNWFPHLSPDGTCAYFLSFPNGTTGHPADLLVDIRFVRGDDWTRAVTVASVFGGQGTVNVNGWAPDSARFAYVEYPIS
ncbi:PD40 domain-containing protein [Cryobacterium sp. TMS1-13-1]|uniref:TolB family protein n=1 Tax=Cryobacterium sp. TMS1-13-1 TaxID=1259220 RepID=UPI00106CE085|nr:PD40 domain-containing protein [Cryobacterium sp. TMS1-13-1]TFD25682.1 biopolymer transporter Tol [Cryobacterium sp. TMS1-13-1]